MSINLKKLNEQIMVITGASSGIGLTTARMAAEKGAKLVLAARSEDALNELVEELKSKGCEAIYVKADVSKEDEVKQISQAAIDHFGGFDTWVNNAGVSIYGKLIDIPTEDLRQLFETNFWGVVYGSIEAARHLHVKGGAIINIGSTLSDVAIPVQGMYSATKHAVKGFTDALRMELEAEGSPISVTLVKPSAIDTPYVEHAKNYLFNEPDLPMPIYSPDIVAQVILHCAEHPERDMFAGGGGKLLSMMGYYAPRLYDKVMENFSIDQQKKDKESDGFGGTALYEASGDLRERGGTDKYVSETSLYDKAVRNPAVTGAILAGTGLALAAALWKSTNSREKIQ